MAVKPIPEGYHSLTPYLTVRNGAAMIEFYKTAFGATEIMRLELPGGHLAHAEMKIGDSHFMLGDESPAWGNKSPQTVGGVSSGLCLYVEDCDAVFDRALAAGATVHKPMTDQFYGDRSGTVADPSGHYWTIGTHKEDVSPAEMKARMDAMMAGQKG